VYIAMHMCMCKAHLCACLHKPMCSTCDTFYIMYIVDIGVTRVDLTYVCGLCSTYVLRHACGGEVTTWFVHTLSVWMRQAVACSCVFCNPYHYTGVVEMMCDTYVYMYVYKYIHIYICIVSMGYMPIWICRCNHSASCLYVLHTVCGIENNTHW
jgi:hypothetical protein